MKKEIESANLINSMDRLDRLEVKFGKIEILSSDYMNCIRGGDGEDNGGGNIIMPLPPIKK